MAGRLRFSFRGEDGLSPDKHYLLAVAQGRRVKGKGNSSRLRACSEHFIFLDGSPKSLAGVTLALFPIPSGLRPCLSFQNKQDDLDVLARKFKL